MFKQCMWIASGCEYVCVTCTATECCQLGEVADPDRTHVCTVGGSTSYYSVGVMKRRLHKHLTSKTVIMALFISTNLMDVIKNFMTASPVPPGEFVINGVSRVFSQDRLLFFPRQRLHAKCSKLERTCLIKIPQAFDIIFDGNMNKKSCMGKLELLKTCA